MQDNTKGIWGRGWSFPPIFSLSGQGKQAGPVLVEDQEDIRQSLRILFNTLPGERIMRADYGCDLNAVLFDNISEDLLAQLRRMIRDSVLRYEPRVELLGVDGQHNAVSPTRLDVRVNYRVRGSDATGEVSAVMDMASAERLGFQ